jgi:purine-binding chemotaxis protein CheW
VIPVVDLRLKFGFEAQDYTERTCIIVAEVSMGGASVMVGMVVDSVSEVLNIAGTDIAETPDFGGRVRTDFILALAKSRGSVKILLDLDRVLAADSQVGGPAM